ncbi:hypothetical protein FRB96_007015 [Tulasnella sp. 330]|nr:hypothetical protein FRB96_007015 [Tulasnella sp. 330]KAG8887626.1 hypothetical protein FRB98_009294 [Tulasnella sp. 332]
MPKSRSTEIDAIFSGKGKGATASSVTHQEKASESGSSKKKRKRSEALSADAVSDMLDASDVSAVKRPAPQMILDPSLKIEAQVAKATQNTAPEKSMPAAKRTKTAKSREIEKDGSYMQKKKAELAEKEKDSDRKFADSRGAGPRRKTEEGFLIYKEDELGIRDEGGGY